MIFYALLLLPLVTGNGVPLHQLSLSSNVKIYQSVLFNQRWILDTYLGKLEPCLLHQLTIELDNYEIDSNSF
eukprot:NP_001293971.1 Uncharacterized protein CELE_Y57G11B.223 [Caenorhabditis elegans]